MTCTHTGAHVWIEQYGEFAYGDAFEVESVAYFNIVMRSRSPITTRVKHYTVHEIEHWFGPHELDTNVEGKSVLISARFTNHGYEGVPI